MCVYFLLLREIVNSLFKFIGLYGQVFFVVDVLRFVSFLTLRYVAIFLLLFFLLFLFFICFLFKRTKVQTKNLMLNFVAFGD